MILLSYQKNTDLHALSAATTMNAFLNCDQIKKCRRFIHWDIDVNCENEEQWVDNLLNKTYYL